MMVTGTRQALGEVQMDRESDWSVQFASWVVIDVLWAAFREAVMARRAVVGTADLLAQIAVRSGFGRTYMPGVVDLAAISRRAPAEAVPDGASATMRGPASVGEASAILREVAWQVHRAPRARSRTVQADPAPPPKWSGEVYLSLENALSDAASAHDRCVNAIYLARGLLSTDTAAARVLVAEASVDLRVVRQRLAMTPPRRDCTPWTPAVDSLTMLGALAGTGVLRGLGLPLRWLAHLARPSHSEFLTVISEEAARLAVRLDHSVVTSAHLLVAILSADYQLALAGRTVITSVANDNQGGSILTQAGLTYPHEVQLLVRLAKDGLEGEPASERRPVGVDDDRDPPWSDEALRAIEHGDSGTGSSRRSRSGSTMALVELCQSRAAAALLELAGVDRAGLLAAARANV